jgi:hypothetical protein
MKLPLALLAIAVWFVKVYGQQATDCPADLVVTDDCTDVMNPIACYNQYRWNTRTLSCIEGANDTERKRKVRRLAHQRKAAKNVEVADLTFWLQACKCCACIGTVMCNWVKTQKYCS